MLRLHLFVPFTSQRARIPTQRSSQSPDHSISLSALYDQFWLTKTREPVNHVGNFLSAVNDSDHLGDLVLFVDDIAMSSSGGTPEEEERKTAWNKGRKKERSKELNKGIEKERNKERKAERKKYLDYIRNIQKGRRKDLPLCTPFPLAREWFADKGLALNESKTQVIICTMD